MNQFNYITKSLNQASNQYQPYRPKGRVTQVSGTVIKAIIPQTGMGEICLLRNPGDSKGLRAEVVGFENEIALLMPMDDVNGVSSSTEVITSGLDDTIGVGMELKGRILDAYANPIDVAANGPLNTRKRYPINALPPNPLSRTSINKPIELGIKSIDGFLTCGEGQRMGIFSAAGVGKSVLLEMMVKNANVDIVVVALIGERGREVREFIEENIKNGGMQNTVMVVATADRPPLERVKAAHSATAIAEYFRDQGQRVLLLMDSVTRYARAQREIGLAAGETPTRRGYPPSVFGKLPKLFERAGNSSSGSITAFYTVLVEADDMNEPVADEVRSLLDGHIVLSRELAAKHHYPAVDVLDSLSRSMQRVVSDDQLHSAGKVRRLLSKLDEIKLLLRVGEYKQGTDPEADEAIRKKELIESFLQQARNEDFKFESIREQLLELAS
ncbi:MAG: FliI/YscN family ATPase [Gammaproteobacteria bacterium]